MTPRTFLAALLASLAALLLSPSDAFAGKETYEFVTYDAPSGWTKEVKALTYTSYTTVDKRKGTYCRIFVMLSTAGKGNLKEDFETEWKNLVATQYGVTDAPNVTDPGSEKNGWKIKSAKAPFQSGGAPATVMITTMSGYGKVISIVGLTNGDGHLPAIRKFMDSVELGRPAAAAKDAPAPTSPPAKAGTTALATTRFDDGWTSSAQEDWVQVSKGSIRVLIHYPNKNADAYNSVLLDGLKNAWSLLVAPRYGSTNDLAFRPISGWETIEYASASAVEKSTGKAVYVVLFKKNDSNGSGRYLELIAPDKKSFEAEFGAYHEASYGWEKLEKMANYNKFAVAAADLQGTWSTDFSGSISYVNAATGLPAGTNTHASVENFRLGPGSAYSWDLGVASGSVGNIKFQSVKSSGTFSVPGQWNITFSDIEGKPRTYEAHFSHIKGLRVLWLDNRPFANVK